MTKRPLEEDGYFQKLVAELTLYGLSSSQARLYLFLLGRSPLSAGQISKQLGVHRVDVYRQLRQLGDAGIVELFLDSPKKFAASDPKTALTSLTSRVELKLVSLRELSFGLEERLRIFEANQKLVTPSGSKSSADSYYKFASGR